MLKKKSIKRVVTICLTAVILFGCLSSISVVNAIVAPYRWTAILSIDINMTFDGNTGDVLGIARKQTSASKIEGTVYVYKLVGDEWIYIDEWYDSKTRGTLAVGDTFPCESGVTYKAVFVVTAYVGTTSETETVEYIEICP